MGVPGCLECALDGCLVWASAPVACHLWVSFQVTPPKRAAAFTAVPQSLRLLLTRTRHALQHILTLFFGGWVFVAVFVRFFFFFLFCHPTLAHCNTKIGHFSALGVFHPHCCRSSNLKCDSQVASARPHIQGDGRHKRTLQTACFLRCRSRCLIHANV